MLSASLVERKVPKKEITMAKKAYSKPMLKSEAFVPQSYVAACGDSGTVYKFTCDASGGPLYYFPDKPASGAQPTVGSKGTYIGINYHPCGEYHEADTQSGFYWGYVDYGGSSIFDLPNGKLDDGELVIVWRGVNNDNGHATTNLNMSSWATAKS